MMSREHGKGSGFKVVRSLRKVGKEIGVGRIPSKWQA